MSPTSTSEPVSVATPPPLPAPSLRARLWRPFFADAMLACLALVGFSCLLVVPLVALEMMRVSGGDLDTIDLEALEQSLLPQITAASVVAMLLAGLLVWWFRGRKMPPLAVAMPPARAYPLAFVAGIAIQAACQAIVILSDAAGTTIAPSNADPVQEMARQVPWLAWLMVVVVAPLAEELLFRHVLLRRFAAAGRGLLGLAVTSLLFAALHEVTPGVPSWPAWAAAVALYVAMGAGFGAVYLWTRRFGAAVVAHAACNLAAMGLAAFSLL